MQDVHSTLKLVYDAILDSDVTWVLTGSLAFSLRGMDMSVGDIDIQTDMDGAYEIERRLMRYVIEPVQFKAAPRIRSHFGRLLIGGMSVEIMGDIEKLTPDGAWLPTPPLKTLIEQVTYGEMCIPVLNLEYEYQAYMLMGRTHKAQLIRNWLHIHQSPP